MLKPIFQKVLVACNGSQASMQAVMYGIILAKQYGVKLKVVSVVDTSIVRQLKLNKIFIEEEAAETAKSLEEDAKRSILEVEKLAGKKGIEIKTEILYGTAWSCIIKAAEDFNADLILIGSTKKYSGSQNLIHSNLGEHESEIVASARCSVMVVMDKFVEQKFKLL